MEKNVGGWSPYAYEETFKPSTPVKSEGLRYAGLRIADALAAWLVHVLCLRSLCGTALILTAARSAAAYGSPLLLLCINQALPARDLAPVAIAQLVCCKLVVAVRH